MKFCPGDEEKETSLRLVGLAAYGLWKRMLNLMHEAQPYGHLCTPSGQPIAPEQLAALVGARAATVRRLLADLEAHQVFSRTETGVIFCRRMVRDRHVSEVRSVAGSRGGNPALTRNQRDNGADLHKQTDKQTAKQSLSIEVRPQKSEDRSQKSEPPPPTEAAAVPSEAIGDTATGGDGRLVALQEVEERTDNGTERSVSPDVSARMEEIARRRVTQGKSNTMVGARKWCAVNYQARGEVYAEIHGVHSATNHAAGCALFQRLGVTLPEHLTPEARAKVLRWVEEHAEEAGKILTAVRETKDSRDDPNRVPGLFCARVGQRMKVEERAAEPAGVG
jgi:hypothetical protein